MVRLLQFLLHAAVAGAGAATLLARWPESFWVMEYLPHFRVQYLVVLVACGLLALAGRRWKTGLLALALAVPNLLAVAPYLPGMWPSSPRAADEDLTRLVALNLFYLNDEHGRVRRYLDGVSPDVMVFSEYTPDWQQALTPLAAQYPHRVEYPIPGAWGMAVYSRHPLREVIRLSLGDSGRINLRLMMRMPRGDVEIWALHLSSPTSPAAIAARQLETRRLAGILEGTRDTVPRLLVGDFNMTPFTPAFQRVLAAGRLRDARVASGLQVTWPSWAWPLGVAIDHCLVNARVDVRHVIRGPSVNSDHWPVEVGFRIVDDS